MPEFTSTPTPAIGQASWSVMFLAIPDGLPLAWRGVHAMSTSPNESRIGLQASGPEGTAYSITCTVTRTHDVEEVEFEGVVPLEVEFEGIGVDCRVVQLSGPGYLDLVLTKNGHVTRSRCHGLNSTMNLRIR
jgi:hypothetical protein